LGSIVKKEPATSRTVCSPAEKLTFPDKQTTVTSASALCSGTSFPLARCR